MDTINATKNIVTGFIEEIWNQKQFDKADRYLHPDFIDHSLPPTFPADKDGTIKWIIGTGISFENKTVIEEQVTEGEKTILKISMHLKHIGTWRDIEPTGAEISAVGYRYFRITDNKIREHWALIDGNAIEAQLRKASHGCKIQL